MITSTFTDFRKQAAIGVKPTPGTVQSLMRYGHLGDLVRGINAVKRDQKPVYMINSPYIETLVDNLGLGTVSKVLSSLKNQGVKVKQYDDDMLLYRRPSAVKALKGAHGWEDTGKAFGYKNSEIEEFVRGLASKKSKVVPESGPGVRGMQRSKQASVSAHLRAAINATHTHPTPAQASAGNYRKGEFDFRPGMTVKIENPDGSTRRGYKDGKEIWSRVMNGSYGYFKGTKAADGDAVDCFVGPHLDSDVVVAIDQYKGDKFDETKFILGTKSEKAGTDLYLSNYPKGWKLGPVCTLTVSELRTWLKEGKHAKPFEGQLEKKATNEWTRRVQENALSEVGLERLYDSGIASTKPRPTMSRERLGLSRIAAPVAGKHQIVPGNITLQSPGMSLAERRVATQEASGTLQRLFSAMRKAPSETTLERTPTVLDAMFQGSTNTLSLPDRSRVLSLLNLDNIDRHEMGHRQSMLYGAGSTGNYPLQDRLLAHKLERAEPGILMKNMPEEFAKEYEERADRFTPEQIRQQLAGRHNERGKLIEEAMAERNARLVRPIPDLSIKGPLNHLRVNYGAEGHATPLLQKIITAAKGMPYALQSVAVEPLNMLGGKQIPGKLAGLLKGILRR
jgi:hypothetical protein